MRARHISKPCPYRLRGSLRVEAWPLPLGRHPVLEPEQSRHQMEVPQCLVAVIGCTTDEGDCVLDGRTAAILVDAALGVEGTPHLMPGTPQGSASGQSGCPHTD
jgi:hypothetical protein